MCELIKCECGHECPIDYVIIDADANYTCPNCYIDFLKTKTLKYKLLQLFNFLKYEISQFKFGRKLYGGTWYLIHPSGLNMGTFWSDKRIVNCQSEVVKIENY